MRQKMKVAAIQMDAVPLPVTERLDRAANHIAEAVAAGAELVVLPEMFNTGYEYHERNFALAENLEGETVTWMKTLAARHRIHLAGSLLLQDQSEIYNAGFLVAPDSHHWRHDKVNVTLWERAYFRAGTLQATIADTVLGKIGLMICSDVLHPELWAQYAGKVDLMVAMFSPGNTSKAALIFPDGYRLSGPEFEQAVKPSGLEAYPGFEVMKKFMAWMPVPMIAAGGTGMVRTGLPGLADLLQGSTLSGRAEQAAEVWYELPFGMATMVMDLTHGLTISGTDTGDQVISAEIELAAETPQPSAPPPDVPPFHTNTFEHYIAQQMLPFYQAGLRNLR